MSDEAYKTPTLPPGAATPDDLFARLDALGVAHRTVAHPAFFTVEDGRDFKAGMPGRHSKNLFLKDKKGAMTLAVAEAETRADLVALGKAIGAKGRLSFGKPDLMAATLGVTPGSVTPFCLMNETASALDRVILDSALLEGDLVWFHPLVNTASTGIAPDDLVKFVESCGFTPEIRNLAAPLEA